MVRLSAGETLEDGTSSLKNEQKKEKVQSTKK